MIRRSLVACVICLATTALGAAHAQAETRSLYYKVTVSVVSDTDWVLDGRNKCGGYPESAFPDKDFGYEEFAQGGDQGVYFSNTTGLRRPLPVRVYGTPGRLRLDPMGEGHRSIVVDGRETESFRIPGFGQRRWEYESHDTPGADGTCPTAGGDDTDPRYCGSRRFDGDFALVPKGLHSLQVRSRSGSMFTGENPWIEPETSKFCLTGSPFQDTLLVVRKRRENLARDLVLAGRKRVRVVVSNREKPWVDRFDYEAENGSFQHKKATTVFSSTVTFERTTKKQAMALAERWAGPPVSIPKSTLSLALERAILETNRQLEVSVASQDAKIDAFHRAILSVSTPSARSNRALGTMAAAAGSKVGSARFHLVHDNGERAVARVKLSRPFYEELQRTGSQRAIGTVTYRSQGKKRTVTVPFTLRAPNS